MLLVKSLPNGTYGIYRQDALLVKGLTRAQADRFAQTLAASQRYGGDALNPSHQAPDSQAR